MCAYVCKIVFKCDLIIISILAWIYKQNSSNFSQTTAKTRIDEKLFETIMEVKATVPVRSCIIENNNIIIISNIVLEIELIACIYKYQTALKQAKSIIEKLYSFEKLYYFLRQNPFLKETGRG